MFKNKSMKVFYLGVDVSKKKLDLCLRSNGKDILYNKIISYFRFSEGL